MYKRYRKYIFANKREIIGVYFFKKWNNFWSTWAIPFLKKEYISADTVNLALHLHFLQLALSC